MSDSGGNLAVITLRDHVCETLHLSLTFDCGERSDVALARRQSLQPAPAGLFVGAIQSNLNSAAIRFKDWNLKTSQRSEYANPNRFKHCFLRGPTMKERRHLQFCWLFEHGLRLGRMKESACDLF